MEKLGLHIIDLLKGNPQVYLPGVGLFKKQRIAATFEQSSNSFHPPSHQIVLFPHEKGDPLLLIESIRQEEEITIEESEEQLKKVIGSILLEVSEKGKVDIPGFGSLSKGQNGFTFTQKELKETLPFFNSIKEIKLISPIRKQEIPKEIHATIGSETSKIGQDAEDDTVALDEVTPSNRTMNWLWPVIAILAVFSIGAYWYMTQPKDVKQEPKELAQQPITQSTILTEELDSAKVEPLIEETMVDGTKTAGTALQDTDLQEKTTFEIIVVSFGKQEDAEKYVSVMKEKGYNLHILENRRAGNQIKVSYGSFLSEQEAQATLNEVRESFSKHAWIFKKIHTK